MADSTAVVSWEVEGKKDDISDFVTNLSPDMTLLIHKFGNCEITQTYHEWLNDSLRPPQVNAQPEVFDFSTVKAVPRRRMGNYVQQLQTGYSVSDVTQAIQKYGVKDESGYQFIKAGKEMAQDIEYAIAFNAKTTSMDNGATGMMGGLPYFLDNEQTVSIASATGLVTLADHKFVTGDAVVIVDADGTTALPNTQYFVAYVDANTFYLYPSPQAAQASITGATGVSSGTGALKITATTISSSNIVNATKDSKAGKLSLDIINEALQLSYNRGGTVDSIIMSANQKKNCTDLGGVLRVTQQTDDSIVQGIDVIDSEFGNVQLVPHRLYQNHDDVIDLLDTQYFNVGYLIPLHTEPLPRAGTTTQKIITGVVGMECRAPSASARIKNLTGGVYTKPVVVQTVTA